MEIADHTAEKPLILVTGGWGYLGSWVTQNLLNGGYRVRVVDPHPGGEAILAGLPHRDHLRWWSGDISFHDNATDLLDDVDSIVHLAGVDGHGACAAFPDHAVRLNYHGTLSFARRARLAGVRRFVFVSSCSLYSESAEKWVHEFSPIEPRTLYGQLKAQTEVELLALSHQDFGVTILRLANLFGFSPRMRFDLSLNRMMMDAWRSRVIKVHGTGKQIRPYLLVDDAACAIVSVLKKDPAVTRAQIFNVGRDDQNCRVGDLASEISAFFLGTSVVHLALAKDQRQYRVSFEKFATRIGLSPGRSVRDGLLDLAKNLEDGKFPEPEDARYHNVEAYKASKGFLYGPLLAAQGSLWQPYKGQGEQVVLKKPFQPSQTEVFRKTWRDKPRIIGVWVAMDVASRLPELIRSLSREVIDEMILVDNGSQDATSSMAKHLGLKVVRHDRPLGYGLALKSGVRKAMDRGADYVMVLSASPDLAALERLEPALHLVMQGLDVVLGSRMLLPYRALVEGMSFGRYLRAKWVGRLLSEILGSPLTDPKPPIQFFHRSLLEKILATEVSTLVDAQVFSLRLLLQAAHFGVRWEEFSVPYLPELKKEPTLNDTEVVQVARGFGWLLPRMRLVSAYLLALWGVRYSPSFPIRRGSGE